MVKRVVAHLTRSPGLVIGEHDDRIVQLKDLAPALSWLAGDNRIDLNAGRNLFFRKSSEAAYLVNLFSGALRGGIVVGSLKYHYSAATRSAPEENRLFDLATDPDERTDLWDRRTREGTLLRDRYFGWLAEWERRWWNALLPANHT